MERIHVTILERNTEYLIDQVNDGCPAECSGQLLDAYLNALKFTKYSDKLNIYDYSVNASSPYRDYDPKSPDPAYTPRRSPDNVHKSRTPAHIDKPRSPDNIHKSRSPELIDKSRSPDEIYTPRYPESDYKSKSPDNTHKSRSPDYIYESQDPDYSPQPRSPNNNYNHRSPNKVYKSKSPEKIHNTRSRDHIHDSQDPNYSHKPRSPNNIYTSRSPDNVYKSKSPDSIRKPRSPHHIDESEDLDYNHKPRSPNNIYKARSPDNVYKSNRPDSIRNAQSPDHIDQSEDPDYNHKPKSLNNYKYSYTPRSPDRVYKSKSPDNIRKPRSRHHIYESHDQDYPHKPRKPNNIYESRSPDNVHNSKSPDNIRKSRSRHHTYESQSPDYTHKSRSPDHIQHSPPSYKSRSPDHIDKPRTPDNIRKSRSPDHILESHDRDYINKPRSPDPIYKPRNPGPIYSPRSPDNVYKSRSPDRVNKPPDPVNFTKLINVDYSRPSSHESVRISTRPENFQRRRDGKSNLIPREDIHKSQPTDVYRKARTPHNILGYEASQHVPRPRSREEIDRANRIAKPLKPLNPPKTVSSTSVNLHHSSRSVSSNHSFRSDSGHRSHKTHSLHHTTRNTNPQQGCSKLVSSPWTQENSKPDFHDNAYESCQNTSKTYVIVVTKSESTHKIPKVCNPQYLSKTGSPNHLPKSGGFYNSPKNVNPTQINRPISQENLYMQTSQEYIEKYIEKLHRSTSHLDKNSRQHIPTEGPRRTYKKISPKIPSIRKRLHRSSSKESDHRHNIQERDYRRSRRKKDRRHSSEEIDHKHRSWDKDYKSDIRDAEAKYSSQETIYRSGNLDRDYSHHKSRSWERDSERGLREKDFSHSSLEKVISPVNYESDCSCGNERSRSGSWDRDHSRYQRETEYRPDDKGIYYPYDNQRRINRPNSYERDHSRDKRDTVNRSDNFGNDYRRDSQERVNRPNSLERDYRRDNLGNDYRRDSQERVNRPNSRERYYGHNNLGNDYRRDSQERVNIPYSRERDYRRDNLGNDYRRDNQERVNRPDSSDRDYTRDSRERVNRPETRERDYQRDRRDAMNRPDGWERDYRQDSRDGVNRPDTWDRNYRHDNQERLNRPDNWEGDYRRENQDRLNRRESWDRDHRYYRPGRLDNVAGDYRGIDGDSSKNVMQKGSLYDNYEDDKKYKEQKFKEKRHKYLWKRWERLTKRRSSDMDGLQRVLRQLGEFGPYQCMLLCVASPVFFMWAYILYAQIFVLATPSDYFCETENLRPKFACEIANKDLKGTPHITFFMGAFLGSIILGVIADTKGRLYALVASNVVVVVGSVISALLTDLKAFATARFFTGLGYDTCFMAIYILVVECVGPSKRAMAVNALIAVFFGIGGLLLPSIASLIANWQRFLVATSLPMLMVIAIRFMVPESLRWLLQQGKWTEAIRVIKKMQIARKFQVHPEDLDRLMVETVNSPVKTGIRDAMSSPYIRIMVLIFCVLFFIVMMLFEFLILILEFIEVDFFNAFRYSAALEIPAGLVGGFLMNNCGRRLLTWVPMIASAVYIIAAHYYFKGVVFATLVIMGRLYIAVSRNTLFLWMTEVMPTGARAAGSGLAHASGHLGCIVAPIFAHMVGIHKIYWPLIFMGALLIFSTILVCMLPETCHKPLPQKISMAKKRFQKSLRNFKSKFTMEGLVGSVNDRRRREYDKSPLAQPMATPAAYGDTPPEDPLRPIMPRQWRTSDGII